MVLEGGGFMKKVSAAYQKKKANGKKSQQVQAVNSRDVGNEGVTAEGPGSPKLEGCLAATAEALGFLSGGLPPAAAVVVGHGGRGRGAKLSPGALSLFRVEEAAFRCHELRQALGEAAAIAIVKRTGAGDDAAARALGVTLSPRGVERALARVAADLALLALDDDPELSQIGPSVPLGADAGARVRLPKAIDYAAAEALRWLAWQCAWHAALARAASGDTPVLVEEGAQGSGMPVADLLRPGRRLQLVDRAKTAWLEACRRGGSLSQELAETLVEAATAVARHTAARRVSPKSKEEAKDEWVAFEHGLQRLTDAKVLHEDCCESVKWLLWNASWHASTLVSQHQSEGDSDEEEDDEDDEDEEDEEIFGKGYPGLEDDPLSNLANFLRHAVECHRDNETNPSWRGLCLPAAASPSDVREAAAAGFNVIRIPVATPAEQTEALGPAQAVIAACSSAGVRAVLDLSAWSVRSRQKHEGREGLGRIAAAASAYDQVVCGVVLPRVPLQSAAPFVNVLRAGGLRAASCAMILHLTDAPLDDDGDYSGSFRKALCEGESGLLLSDGHVVMELRRRAPDDVEKPQALLNWACGGDGIADQLHLSCAWWNLSVPTGFSKNRLVQGERWREEFAARHEVGADDTTHGWFATVDNSLRACLSRRWNWPEPLAERTLWPHGHETKAVLVYLHGFTCTGKDYMNCYEYFSREIPANPDDDDEGDEDDEDETTYAPYPGLKVIFPSAPLRPISCYGGDKIHGWYDYTTDHEGAREDDLVTETLEESVLRVHAILDREAGLLGGPGRVFLGGASQGCCTALHAAMTYPGALGGIVATQGHFLSCSKVPSDWAARGTPVRIYHGLADETMPWKEWVSDMYEPLRSSGGDVRHVVDEGVDHGDSDAEGMWVRAFLAEMWGRLGASAQGG